MKREEPRIIIWIFAALSSIAMLLISGCIAVPGLSDSRSVRSITTDTSIPTINAPGELFDVAAEDMVRAAESGYETAARPATGTVHRDQLRDGTLGPEMVFIRGGTFTMGSPESETGRRADERQHQVSVGDVWMGRYAVTFDEYDRFASATGRDSGWGWGRHPVRDVSWHDATAYAEWLSGQTGKRYRLPMEAEWEYAARAGTTTARYWGEAIGRNQANCDGCGSQWDNKQTAPVGSFAPNAWGLYDMLGNVWEWTCSVFDANYGGAEQRCDASGPSRSLRGGSWDDRPDWVRSAARGRGPPRLRHDGLGLRLARSELTPSPSFACEQATHVTEHAICRSLDLAEADVANAQVYGEVMRYLDESGRMALVNNQRAFLQERSALPTVAYQIESDRIVVLVDGEVYPAGELGDYADAGMRLSEEASADWDGDGIPELLYLVSTGGNCCPGQYKLMSYHPERGLSVNALSKSWWKPSIEWRQLEGMEQAAWVFTFFTNNEGVNTNDFQQARLRYVVEQGKPRLVEKTEDTELAALVEVRAHQLTAEQSRGATVRLIGFDLDQNGEEDQIVGRLWERWGRLVIEVKWADGRDSLDNFKCKRIGVLATITQGVHDLVCDNSSRLVWDGSRYQEQPDALRAGE